MLMNWIKKLFVQDDPMIDKRPLIKVEMIDSNDGLDFDVFIARSANDKSRRFKDCFVVVELHSMFIHGDGFYAWYEGKGDYSLLTQESKRIEYKVDDYGFDGIEDIMYPISNKEIMINVGAYEFSGEWFSDDAKLTVFSNGRPKPRLLIRKQEVSGEMVKEIILI